MEHKAKCAFAVWVTGLPASGKSTLVAALTAQLASMGVENIAVLESDELRRLFTPQPRYDEQERDAFYRQMVYVGALLTKHGVPVVFDATANLRAYRERARQQILDFMEVYVECPLAVCMARDPKGIYRDAQEGSNTVPGLQTIYEPPEKPDVVISGTEESPDAGAKHIIAVLSKKRYI